MSAIAEGNIPDKAWKQRVHQAEWRIGDTINAAIGQGYVLASPLQLAVMTARIASGKKVLPRLIKRINDVETEIAPPLALDVAVEKLQAVQMGMFSVVNSDHGTARASRVVDETMVMCGKTGTAQVRNIPALERETGVIKNDKLPWEKRDHALFVGFAPADAPRYAVAVVVEHGGGGSAVAAPIARDALLAAMTGGIPPIGAYPVEQRVRMQSEFEALDLRLAKPPIPTKT
jgi:penicillin-binding protein 2